MRLINMGSLRHRVTVQKAVKETNDRGVETWAYPGVEDFNVWAHIESYGAKINNGEAEKVSAIEYRITVRYRPDIGEKDRIFHRGRIFVQTLPPQNVDERSIFLRLQCEELIPE